MKPLIPFHRYEGAETADKELVMPSDELRANVLNVNVSELLGRLEQFTTGEEGPHMYPWASRFVMGYPLPRWQRDPDKWEPERKARFIHSIWSGVDVGTHLVNDAWELEGTGATLRYRELSQALLDGQQRLTALEEYLYNGFAVPDAKGELRFWSDLPRSERRRFGNFHFAKATIASWDEDLLLRAYELRAIGGVAHDEQDIARLRAARADASSSRNPK